MNSEQRQSGDENIEKNRLDRWFKGITILGVLYLIISISSSLWFSLDLYFYNKSKGNEITITKLIELTTNDVVIFSIILLLNSGLVEKIEKFVFSKDGVELVTKKELKQEINQLETDINSLLISTVLDAYEYITLLKITGEEKNSKFDFNYPKGQDLLERLRNRGLIDEIGNNTIFNDRNNREIDLKEHFLITERGQKYLEVLKQKDLGEDLYKIAQQTGYSG